MQEQEAGIGSQYTTPAKDQLRSSLLAQIQRACQELQLGSIL